MKHSKKIALAVSGICFSIGIILAFIAIAMIDFDFKRLSTESFEDKGKIISEDFESIEISGFDCDVKLEFSTSEQSVIEYSDSNAIKTDIRVENNTLKISRRDNRKWYEHIGIYFGGAKPITVYLPVPEGKYKSLTLKTVSGSINVNSFSFDSINLSSTSGDIKFFGECDGDFSVKTVSGDIDINHLVCGITNRNVKFNASSTSGDIYLGALISGNASLKTVSGDIELDKIDAVNITAKTTSGDIEGSITAPKKIIAKTVSGDIDVPKSDDLGGEFKASTTSGDIEIDIIR